MARLVVGTVAVFFLGLASIHAGATGSEKALGEHNLRYSVAFQNGEDIIAWMNKTDWLTDLQKSNLYRGLSLRFNGLSGALPSHEKPGWTGRFADYVMGQVLKGRATELWYFQAPNLVSPIGFSVRGLSATELSVVNKLRQALEITQKGGFEFGEKQGSVSAIGLSSQKVAVAIEGNCVGVARDPAVAFASAVSCQHEAAPASAAEIKIHLSSLASATSTAMNRWLGLGPTISLRFEKSQGRDLNLAGAVIPLEKGSVLADGQIPRPLLEMLPAKALIVTAFNIPRPSAFTVAGAKALLKGGGSEGGRLVASFVFLGMSKRDGGGTQSNVAVVIPQPEKKIKVDEFTSLFETYRATKEVFVREICKGKGLAVSPVQDVFAQLEDACSKKVPNLTHMPKALVDGFVTAPAAQSVMINFGEMLSEALDSGIQQDQADGLKDSPEVKEAAALLKRLPAVLMMGKINKNSLEYTASTGVF